MIAHIPIIHLLNALLHAACSRILLGWLLPPPPSGEGWDRFLGGTDGHEGRPCFLVVSPPPCRGGLGWGRFLSPPPPSGEGWGGVPSPLPLQCRAGLGVPFSPFCRFFCSVLPLSKFIKVHLRQFVLFYTKFLCVALNFTLNLQP